MLPLRFALAPLIALLMVACTTTDPYTGEQRVDETATAGAVAGLAVLGAVAYAASKADDDDDDDDDDYRHHRRHRDYDEHRRQRQRATFSPHRDITCYSYRHACYDERGHYSSKWTRRVF